MEKLDFTEMPSQAQLYQIHRKIFGIFKQTYPQAPKFVLYRMATEKVFKMLEDCPQIPKQEIFDLRAEVYMRNNRFLHNKN